MLLALIAECGFLAQRLLTELFTALHNEFIQLEIAQHIGDFSGFSPTILPPDSLTQSLCLPANPQLYLSTRSK